MYIPLDNWKYWDWQRLPIHKSLLNYFPNFPLNKWHLLHFLLWKNLWSGVKFKELISSSLMPHIQPHAIEADFLVCGWRSQTEAANWQQCRVDVKSIHSPLNPPENHCSSISPHWTIKSNANSSCWISGSHPCLAAGEVSVVGFGKVLCVTWKTSINSQLKQLPWILSKMIRAVRIRPCSNNIF